MIATKLAALMMTAMIIGLVGISVAAAPLTAQAGSISTTRSNIKATAIGQQDGGVSCTNQAQGQGGQQDVSNTEQNTAGIQSDPIPGVDVKLGKNPGGSGAGAGINSEGDPTVDAEQSNECALTLSQTVEQNGDTEDSSSNSWEG
jgi:type IV secretory pathway TrbL component